jgi:hypothetical protein
MPYRHDIKSMDKDTILFVRQNKLSLAYNWNYYNTIKDVVSKEFLYVPPVAVYYKASHGNESWVVMRLAIEDGRYNGISNVPDACYYAFAHGNRLVRDLDIDIPSVAYIDEDGFKYTIGLNDGTETCVLGSEITVGGDDTTDVKIEQYSVANPNLLFRQRHLMDDIKLTFKPAVSRDNSIVTYNSIITPLINEPCDPSIAYLRNGLRNTSYNTNDISTDEYQFPMNPLVKEHATYLSAAIPKGVIDDTLYFIGKDHALYRILADGTIWRSMDPYQVNFTQITYPSLITDQLHAISDEQLKLQYPINNPFIISIDEHTLIMFAPEQCNINCEHARYKHYALSFDNGESWERYPLQSIINQGDPVIASPIVGIALCPYMPSPLPVFAVCIAATVYYYTIEILRPTMEIVWTFLTTPATIKPPYNMHLDRPNIVKLEASFYRKRLITQSSSDTVYVDYNNQIMVKNSQGQWTKFHSYSDLYTAVSIEVKNNYIEDNVVEECIFNIKLHYIADPGETGVLQVAYCLLARDDVIGTPTIWSQSGVCYYVQHSYYDNTIVLKSHTKTNKSLRQAMETTNQHDINVAHGVHTVLWDEEEIVRFNNKWIIRDKLGYWNTLHHITNCPSNSDYNGNYLYRCSEDLMHWYPVRGISSGFDTPNTTTLVHDDENIILFFPHHNEIIPYHTPIKTRYHYDIRVRIHKWPGVNITPQIQAIYINTGDEHNVAVTTARPIKIGFPIALNPNAALLFYNGIPLLNDQAYVNPENDHEFIIEGFLREKILQDYINPIQYLINERQYIYNDFTCIMANAVDPAMNCFIFIDKARTWYNGRECYAEFNNDLYGDLILFNGIDNEYVIIDRRTIKYTISRFGLHEVCYAESPYMRIGNYHVRDDIPINVYKMQFIVRSKR